ncbi:hypothetical protein [Aneurinibacillus terranovensis]|uniref:hypothetical protein n=1 Tax=Aneurinibacillus terranovensis TaxID=278991 RepID=UPI0003F52D8B|nr:hypothetical protein [Aneurinibacillus terranovensis]
MDKATMLMDDLLMIGSALVISAFFVGWILNTSVNGWKLNRKQKESRNLSPLSLINNATDGEQAMHPTVARKE